MKVVTKYYASIREKVGKSGEEFELKDDASILDFLEAFRLKYAGLVDGFFEAGGLRSGFAVALNGESVERKAWSSTKLKEGDVVVILPPIAGGHLKLGSLTPRCP
ncbi:MAG: sulfur carrier protein ThiS [Candidatus Caldarchaeum sp.]